MIIYRYLLSQYIKVLMLCASSFIAILLTTRLDEIAHFAALGARSDSVLWFGLHQIPYILPLVIPISCLISAIVLVQRLSATQELTALRANGFSLQKILAPILITSAFFSLANFYIVSELATESHLAARKLEHDLRLINPLLLVKNKHLSKIKDVYVQAANTVGDSVSDLFLAIWDKRNHRINLVYAKKLGAEGTTLYGKDVTIIANMENPHQAGVSHSTSSAANVSPVDREHCPSLGFSQVSSENGRDYKLDSFSIAREHCPTDKARAIENEDSLTDRSYLPRICEKYERKDKARAIESEDGVTDHSVFPNMYGKSRLNHDNVVIENIGNLKSSFEDFSHLLKQRIWRLKHNDYLRMSLLIYHIKHTYQNLIKAEKNHEDPTKIAEIKQTIATSLSEISRRISIALAVFTFTLMGGTFGINISKKRTSKGIYAAVFLAIVFLLSFFTAKGLEGNFFLATSLYILPHMAIIFSSIWALCCVSKGYE